MSKRAADSEDFADIRESACARSAPSSPANIGARSIASAPIRPNSSPPSREAGYLAALIPEEYGGSGLPMRAAAAILEEVHAAGCNGAACHAQMYTMGTILRHGSAEQKQNYLPKIASGELRLQAFGVTEPTSGTDTLCAAHHGAGARATTITSSTARRSGPRAPNIPT